MVPAPSATKIHVDNVVENRVTVPKITMNPTTKVPFDIEQGGEEIVSDKDIILKSSTITHSQWVKYYFGCDYPIFNDEINKEFRLFGRSSVIPNNFLPITVVYAIQTICRYGLPGKIRPFSIVGSFPY